VKREMLVCFYSGMNSVIRI